MTKSCKNCSYCNCGFCKGITNDTNYTEWDLAYIAATCGSYEPQFSEQRTDPYYEEIYLLAETQLKSYM